MNKNDLRTKLKSLRAELDRDTKTEKSNRIFERVFKMPDFLQSDTVMIYMSLGNEVETEKLIEYALKIGKNVLVPVTRGDDIFPCKIENPDDVVIGKFGIREPKVENIWQGEIDLVIIPGLGFSRAGGRIGFGKGYYDSFLEKRDTKKIALAYSFQIVDDTFSDEFDIPMDMIITEEELICCEKRQ